ncbi:hypothetical protein [Thiolapillus sp.]
MDPILIADAGPLIALAGIDRLDLLKELFGRVVAPEAVLEECLAGSGEDVRRIEMAINAGWLVGRRAGAEPLTPVLGPGESAVIRLGLENPEVSLLIIDDRLARRHALRRGLSIVGLVRLLAVAEEKGLLDSAGSCIDAMAGNGYRISRDLLEQVRKGS